MIGGGIVALTEVSTMGNTYEGQFSETFSESYRSSQNEQELIGGALICGGALILIVGLVMTVSKSKKQRKKEIEHSILSRQVKNSHNSSVTEASLIKQASNFYELKDYVSAIGVLKRIIAGDPHNAQAHFNLACCYSKVKNIEAFNALGNAIDTGYSNFDRINTHKGLTWLKSQPKYERFVSNGYKFIIETEPIPESDVHQETAEERSIADSIPEQENVSAKVEVITDDKISQLEKLAKLKEQGILTDEEFQEQKKRVLN